MVEEEGGGEVGEWTVAMLADGGAAGGDVADGGGGHWEKGGGGVGYGLEKNTHMGSFVIKI